ncbi:MAG: hypothetical protein ACN6RH_15845 [Stenotrophomonas rhizophila]|uniref:hypothetical protein n=1 Tax=Stenotrophomonas rhizophila TaxID=216778 RepID=UPI003D12BEE0
MKWLENLWNGMSPCMEPGIKNCVVMWDAWAVVVGALVGVFTGLVAWGAWSTSRKATEIADQATRIAKQQKSESDELRDSQRKALEQMLYTEVVGLGMWTESLRTMLGVGMDLREPNGVGHAHTVRSAVKRSQEDWLPVATALQDKLYMLKHGHGEVLSQVIGSSIGIRAIAKEIDAQFEFISGDEQNSDGTWLFFGDSGDLLHLSELIDNVAETAAHLSSKFITVVTRAKVH